MIYIPQKLKVGFQNREDTYTGKLAYIIYYDQKNKLRKEASWQSWRDSQIEPEEYDNTPVSGFVINKNAGGVEDSYSYDVRKSYVRIYDPRGFEFEITIPNLLFILENTSSIKGKGLEGEFVYGWDGTELVLIPAASPEYKNLIETSGRLQSGTYYLDLAEVKIGCKYRIKYEGGEVEAIYMGKHNEYKYSVWDDCNPQKKAGKRHFMFVQFTWSKEYHLVTVTSMKDRVIECLFDGVVENYAELLDKMEHDCIYSPVSRREYIPISYVEFEEKIRPYIGRYNGVMVWDKDGEKRQLITNTGWSLYNDYRTTYCVQETRVCDSRCIKSTTDLKELYDFLQPHKCLSYLANGNLYSEAYCA